MVKIVRLHHKYLFHSGKFNFNQSKYIIYYKKKKNKALGIINMTSLETAFIKLLRKRIQKNKRKLNGNIHS